MKKLLGAGLTALIVATTQAFSQPTLEDTCNAPVADKEVQELVQSYIDRVNHIQPDSAVILTRWEKMDSVAALVKADWHLHFRCYQTLTLYLVYVQSPNGGISRGEDPAGVILRKNPSKPFDNSKGDLQIVYTPQGYQRVMDIPPKKE